MIELSISGKINGIETEVVAETVNGKWQFLFNGKKDKKLEKRLRELMQTKHVIAGTYLPETDKLNLCAIFEGCKFFDLWTQHDGKCYGEIEQIPSEEGAVY